MITIVYGHPWGKSFNAAIRDAVMDALKGREHALLDLYADGFDPAVREADLALYSAGRTNDALAQKYMEILARTREIIYIYPVWWGTEPAIVKGFHDKVLLKGFCLVLFRRWEFAAQTEDRKNDNLQHVRCSWRIFCRLFQ